MTVRRKEEGGSTAQPSGTGLGQSPGSGMSPSGGTSIGQAGTSSFGQEAQSGDLAQQLDRLRKDLADLGSTVRDLAQERSATAQRSLADATDRLSRKGQQIAQDARTAGQQAVEYGSEVARQRYDELETTVRNNPMTAVIVAVGLGYIAGLLSRNRG